MAFGDIKETVTGSSPNNAVTVTYVSATPVADDLNVANIFTDVASLPATPSGFTESSKTTDTSNSDEGAIYFELVVDSNDDTITTGDADDAIIVVMTLFEGAFDSSPLDLQLDTVDAESSADPVATGVSASSISQADELMVGMITQRHNVDHSSDATNRQGTAIPTSAMSNTGFKAQNPLACYQTHQILTGVGTVGISRVNSDTDVIMVTYATFKKQVTGDATVIFRGRIERYE